MRPRPGIQGNQEIRPSRRKRNTPPAIGRPALLFALGTVLLLAEGCTVRRSATPQEKLRGVTATGKSLAVVQLTARDEPFDALPALRVSKALVALLREEKAFRRVVYVFDRQSVPAHADYILLGCVKKGVPRHHRNAAVVNRLLLTLSIVGAGFRKTVKDHGYQVDLEADIKVLAKGKEQPFLQGKHRVSVEDTYADVDRPAIDARLCRLAERNLAVVIINDFFDALEGKSGPK